MGGAAVGGFLPGKRSGMSSSGFTPLKKRPAKSLNSLLMGETSARINVSGSHYKEVIEKFMTESRTRKAEKTA